MKKTRFALVANSFLHLRDANDVLQYADDAKQLPMGITLYSPGTSEFAEAKAQRENRSIDLIRKRGKVEQTAADKAEGLAEFLTRVTRSFDNWGGPNDTGTTDKREIKEVYADVEMVIVATQAEQYLNETANFTQSSATN